MIGDSPATATTLPLYDTPLYDTHCHLDYDPLAPELDLVMQRARDAGVIGVLVPGVHPDQWGDAHALAARFSPHVRSAVGIHPECLPELGAHGSRAALDDALLRLEDAARALGASAIGECGYDGPTARDHGVSLERQAGVVDAHVEVARALSLPLVLHVYGAHGLALERMSRHAPLPRGGVVHGWSGSAELVPRWVALGFHIAIGPSITRATARRPRESARAIPSSHLLLETDAPAMWPEGEPSRRGEPAHVAAVLRAVAEARGEPEAQLAERTTANARALFSVL